MNAMEKLDRTVRRALPAEGNVSLSRPKHPDGIWILRVVKPSGFSIEVEWRPSVRGFGLVAGHELEFGTGVHEIFGSAEGVLQHLVDLYRTESATDPSTPVTLKDLRVLCGATQSELASALEVTTGLIAQRETRDLGTMQVDTVRQIVEALGGTLDLIVKWPDQQPRSLKLLG